MFRAISGCLMSIFLLITQATAEVKIAVKHRVANQAPGYCVWCALDTWGNHTKNKQLTGLTAHYVEHDTQAVSGTPDQVNRQLDMLGVKYDYRQRGRQDFDFIKQHVQADRAVMVSIRDYRQDDVLHAVLIFAVTDEEVWFVDSNDIDWDWSYKTADFKRIWTGWAVVILD